MSAYMDDYEVITDKSCSKKLVHSIIYTSNNIHVSFLYNYVIAGTAEKWLLRLWSYYQHIVYNNIALFS